MRYMGSKSRHVKSILPLLLENHSKDMLYIEPFVGGGNVICKVPFNCSRIGFDSNPYIIALLQAVSKKDFSELSPVSRKLYREVRETPSKFSDVFVGWVAHGCSYNGKWFGGYAGEVKTKTGLVRNYQEECLRSLKQQATGLEGVEFYHDSVFNIEEIPSKATIYCDPPYEGTTGYKDKFNHTQFWEWVRVKSQQGHKVFVSEYNAPSDFDCIWSKEVNSSLTMGLGSKRAVEKLFTLNT